MSYRLNSIVLSPCNYVSAVTQLIINSMKRRAELSSPSAVGFHGYLTPAVCSRIAMLKTHEFRKPNVESTKNLVPSLMVHTMAIFSSILMAMHPIGYAHALPPFLLKTSTEKG